MQATYELGPVHVGRLPKGVDLLKGLGEVVRERSIKVGLVWAIGALESLSYAYYDQKEQRYLEEHLKKELEILSLIGNISQREGMSFIHAHITVSDKSNTWGGHLLEGSKVFAVEYHILELKGPDLIRAFDVETGLFLWQKRS